MQHTGGRGGDRERVVKESEGEHGKERRLTDDCAAMMKFIIAGSIIRTDRQDTLVGSYTRREHLFDLRDGNQRVVETICYINFNSGSSVRIH